MAHAARYNTYRLPIVQRPFGHPNDNSIRMIFAWRRPKCAALLINEARPACEHTTHCTPTVYTRMCSGSLDIIRFGRRAVHGSKRISFGQRALTLYLHFKLGLVPTRFH